jgi:hypothetical protein
MTDCIEIPLSLAEELYKYIDSHSDDIIGGLNDFDDLQPLAVYMLGPVKWALLEKEYYEGGSK